MRVLVVVNVIHIGSKKKNIEMTPTLRSSNPVSIWLRTDYSAMLSHF